MSVMNGYRYTLLRRVSGSATTDQWLGRLVVDGKTDQCVLVKRVRPDIDAQVFLERARVAAKLRHPNLVNVLDVGWLAGVAFAATDYVRADDLRVMCQRLTSLGWRLPIGNTLYITMEVLAALNHAHALGIVHGGVASSTILISRDAAVKLCEPAVLATAAAAAPWLPGELGYASPEQCQRAPVDRRSDLFSVGVVLHELLTGRPLYATDDPAAAMIAIATQDVPPPSVARPDVLPALDAIVLRALAKDPEQRFTTASQMQDAIAAVIRSANLSASASSVRQFLRETMTMEEGSEPGPLAMTDDPGLTLTSEPVRDGRHARSMTPVELALDARIRALPELPVRKGETADPNSTLRGFAPVAPSMPSRPSAPVCVPGAKRTPVSVVVIPPRGSERTSATTPVQRRAPTGLPLPGVRPTGRPTPSVSRAPTPVPIEVDDGAAVPSTIASDDLAFTEYEPPVPPPPIPTPTPSTSSSIHRAEPAVSTLVLPRPTRHRARVLAIAGALIGFVAFTLVVGSMPVRPQMEPPASSGEAAITRVALHLPRADAEAVLDAAAIPPDATPAADVGVVAGSAVPAVAVAPPPTHPEAIASVAVAPDWGGILDRCVKLERGRLSQAERTICGIAACRRGRVKLARFYRSSVRQTAPIEQACAESQLALPTKKRPREDPCERNPLRCRN